MQRCSAMASASSWLAGGHMDWTRVLRPLLPGGGTGVLLSPLLSSTSQWLLPADRRSAGNTPVVSTSRRAPLVWRNKAATTASSSRGFRLQVLYTMRPPVRSMAAPRVAMLSCSGWMPTAMWRCHLRHRSGALRSVPSPVQGTSARMRS